MKLNNMYFLFPTFFFLERLMLLKIIYFANKIQKLLTCLLGKYVRIVHTF